MCRLLWTSAEEKIEGYKIVAKKLKGKRYFSIAMGFKYPLDEHVPVVRRQRKICTTFIANIISDTSVAYSEGMVGRTAVFINLNEAHKAHQHFIQKGMKRGYKLVIVRSEVSIDIMEGFYYTEEIMDCKIAAGRHIHFIEEIG